MKEFIVLQRLARIFLFGMIFLLSIPMSWAGINDGLLQAAESGKTTEVKRLIDKGADVNFVDGNGVCALVGASHFGHKDIVELLLEKGANIDTRTNDGVTALFEAAKMGEADVADVLIARGANLNAESRSGYSPLFIAILQGHPNVARLLVSKNANVNSHDNQGNTPLHVAAFKGDKDIASLLIKKGADVNAQGGDRITPLYLAAKSGNVDVAEVLITHGANIDAKSKSGYTPLLIASTNGDKDIADLLIKNGADINAKDNQGKTPLIWAFTSLYAMSPEVLKIKGAKERQALLELKKQVKGEWQEVALQLINHGADINFKLKDAPPMYISALIGDKELVDALEKKGANLNNGGDVGESPLHAAISEGHIEVAKMLVDFGADVNAKNERSSRTPLHFLAFYSNDRDLAELMIAKGAHINAKDKYGRTPLSYALMKGNMAVAGILRKHGGI